MKIKPKSAHKNLLIYYIIIAINLQHVSVTCCGHLQGGVLRSIYVLCVISLLSHVNVSQIILSVFYILTYIMNLLLLPGAELPS